MTTNPISMFLDRRSGDRRQRRDMRAQQPVSCRRNGERRNVLRQYHPQPWWLQTNYVEELEPPILETASEA